MLSDVIIDGTTSIKDSIVANGDGSVSYTFDNVMSNHEFMATFEEEDKAKWTITTITDEGAEIPEVYTNHKCVSCGGYDHECEVINIFISAENADVTEQN